MGVSDAPALAGVHHLKLPVTDLARSREWYHSRLGYELRAEMVEQGQLMGLRAGSSQRRPRARPCGSIPSARRRPPDSTTSPSACPTKTRSTRWPPG